jgi:hypothetical protein
MKITEYKCIKNFQTHRTDNTANLVVSAGTPVFKVFLNASFSDSPAFISGLSLHRINNSESREFMCF